MKKTHRMAVFTAGGALHTFGLSLSSSLTSSQREIFTVPPTDKSILQATLAGVGLIFGGIGVCYSGHHA